jgi:hypothetical protein
VGSNDPDSIALVRRADIGSSEHAPSRIEPHRGQIPENTSESARSEDWAVLHEDVLRSYLTDDPGHF